MDSITHGVAGALLGKAFYDRPDQPQVTRVAVFAATLGAVFPDSDIILAIFNHGNGASLEIHRGITHSIVCLPVFAVVLAVLTHWYTRWRNIASPGLPYLTLIYAVGLALHIFLDLVTSWGTMIWSPFSKTRAAWDWTFIIDLTVTTIVLLPQIAARSYRSPGKGLALRIGAWVVFSAAALVEYGFSPLATIVAAVIYAAALLAPGIDGRGYGLSRAAWCRAGFAAFVLYMGMQGVAHHDALAKVEQFATSHNLQVERLGALPSTPSLIAWAGMIRASNGVYRSRFRVGQQPEFQFYPDSPDNAYIEAAKQAATAKRFLWFARFPSISYAHVGALHYVDFSDHRFSPGPVRRSPFTVRVTLDDSGKIVHEEWAGD